MRTAGALLLGLAMAVLFLAIITSPHAFAQETHAQFWNEEAARVASSSAKPSRRTAPPSRHYTPPARGYASDAPLLSVASRYVGGRNPTGTRGPWCMDFVKYAIAKAGYPVRVQSRKARDAVRLGRKVSEPRPGDLAVMSSHVTILVRFEGGKLVGRGGNQCGGRVCDSRYAASRVIAYVRVEG